MKLLFFLLLPIFCFGQGLIVNEISNGDSGTKEYFELVVIGSSTNPTGFVDLGGWIIDDNNGDFEGTSTTGIATGHIRINPGYLSSVKPGSIILIYNSAELSFIDDPNDANNDLVYIIPIDDISLDNNNTNPSTTNSSYNLSVYGALKSWVRIGLRNSGDVGQVRKPDGTFFHGFSYGDVLNPFPTFPIEFGGGNSFNVRTGSGTDRNYNFSCGDFTNQLNFYRGTVSLGDETPGQPNNSDNQCFINNLRNGTFNYSDLSDPNNCCPVILSSNIFDFKGIKDNNDVRLQWTIDNPTEIKYIEIERSNNGYNFNTLTQTQTDYYIDNLIYPENYYRLKIVNEDGSYSYSKIIMIEHYLNNNITIYPNPTKDILNIRTDKLISNIKLFDNLGKEILNIDNPTNQINLSDIPKGMYIIKIKIEENLFVKKIILN